MSTEIKNEVHSGSLLEFSSRFHELDGAMLEWWLFKISHRTLILRASHGSNVFGKLYFGSTVLMKILPVMHNVRIRMATEEENSEYRSGLKGRLAEYAGEGYFFSGFSLRNGRCIIESDEGIFSIWAEVFRCMWTEDPELGLQDEKWQSGEPIWDMQTPLWQGGPPVPEL
jgi:hypothetical protein